MHVLHIRAGVCGGQRALQSLNWSYRCMKVSVRAENPARVLQEQ